MSLKIRNLWLMVVGTVSFVMMLLVIPPFSLAAVVLGTLVMVFSVGREGSDTREPWPTNKGSMVLGGLGFTGGLLMLSLTIYRP